MQQAVDLRYDPYDFGIDADPYPLWKRMRDEAPLYYNEQYAFFAVSRFADVDAALKNWPTFRSGKGSVLELIRADVTMPPGMILFEDPPIHDLHRGILSRVFTPKRVLAIEPQVRAYTQLELDRFVGADGFDFVRDLGARLPMRVIGMLLGIPEAEQEAIRDEIHAGLVLDDEAPNAQKDPMERMERLFSDYLDWRSTHPSDDLMTALLTAEFEDETGTPRRLTRTEVLTYVNLLAGAGNDTTARLIGWIGKVLADHPDQLREVAEDHALIPAVVEEVLRFEAPSPVQARYVGADIELHGTVVPAGSVMVLLNGSANRDDRRYPNGDTFDIHREVRLHLSFGYGLHFCLGAALARIEGRIALEEVLRRWPHWEVDADHAVMAHTSTTRGWERLPVRTLTRSHA